MPLSEFLKMARGNLESGQEKASTATDLSSCHKDDLVELVWENGQMMMQGLSSSRAKNSPKIGNSSTSKIGKLGVMDSMLPLSMPADELDLAEEDEMVPWLSYSEDYRSSTLPEISRSVPTHNIVNSEQRNVAISDMVRSNTSDNAITAFRDSIKSLKMQKRNVPDCSSSLLNFSHFQRSRTLLEPNPRNIAEGMAISGSSAIEEKRENKEKENAASSSSRVTNKNDESVGRFTGVRATKEIPIACSSVCSGSSGERASSDHPRALKRKIRDSEDSDFPSEDVDEESGGVKSGGPAHGGVGSKRSRAAEVHNLSERRRRDRINEKMRALQELIPNCNKADKASMLDEAIEYLKTLQLQVQMMSMGAGLYGPSMMFPSHMPHFSPMGLGMGMGFGMEMNGGPIYPVPTMQGAHFSSPLGNPGRGVPMSVPRAPSVPLTGNLSTSSATGLNVTTPILDSRNQVYTDNSQNKSGI